MKGVIFTRVSTKDQEDGHSLNAQLARLRKYSEQKNLTIIKEYQISESSTLGDRKQFNEMIKFIQDEGKKSKSTIALIVDSVDRLQRGFKESALIDDLRKEKILEIHFYKEGFVINELSTNSDIIRWDFGILGAKMYVQSLSDNVKRGNLYALNSGHYPGKPPIGYKKVILAGGKNSVYTMELDEERAHLIQKIFELYATGSYSLLDLQKKCKEWNLTSNKAWSGSKPITKNVIDDIIKNPFYCGEILIKKHNKIYPHKYPTIISKMLFDQCQAVTRGRNKQGNRQLVQTSRKEFIFRSLIKCAVTGRIVSNDRKKKQSGKEYTYLYPWDPNDPEKKHKIIIREDKILKQIQDVFASLVLPEDLLAEATKYLRGSNDAERKYHKAAMISLEKQVQEIEERESKLLDLYLEKKIPEDMFNKKREELSYEKVKANSEREIHQGADENFKDTIVTAFQLISKAHEMFLSSKIEQKRQLINFVFSNLKLNGAELRYELRRPFNLLVNLANHPDWRRKRYLNRTFLCFGER